MPKLIKEFDREHKEHIEYQAGMAQLREEEACIARTVLGMITSLAEEIEGFRMTVYPFVGGAVRVRVSHPNTLEGCVLISLQLSWLVQRSGWLKVEAAASGALHDYEEAIKQYATRLFVAECSRNGFVPTGPAWFVEVYHDTLAAMEADRLAYWERREANSFSNAERLAKALAELNAELSKVKVTKDGEERDLYLQVEDRPSKPWSPARAIALYDGGVYVRDIEHPHVNHLARVLVRRGYSLSPIRRRKKAESTS